MKYDEKYLYIGIKAYGDPDKIRSTLKNRDETWNEDYVALMVDPFRDGRYGILVGVNALGVQLDEKHISNGEPDDAWDILFQSATAMQDDGYSAELMIPFAELQLPDTEVQKWKVGFIRKSYEAGIETVFGSFKNLPAETCYACQADEEILLGSPEKIYRNYLYPYIFLNQNGDRPVKDFNDLRRIISGHRPGDKSKVTVTRIGIPQTGVFNKEVDMEVKATVKPSLAGVMVDEIPENCPLYKAGLRKGHVITNINVAEVKTAEEFNKVIKDSPVGPIRFVYSTNAKELVIDVEFGEWD